MRVSSLLLNSVGRGRMMCPLVQTEMFSRDLRMEWGRGSLASSVHFEPSPRLLS